MDGLEMKYFVLKPRAKYRCDQHAIASREAMRVYAGAIRDENPQLADQLIVWVEKESKKQAEDFMF